MTWAELLIHGVVIGVGIPGAIIIFGPRVTEREQAERQAALDREMTAASRPTR